jgi:hypothetical protein
MHDLSTAELTRAATALLESAAASEWRGPDLYDGLWWGWPRALTGGRRRRQALIQAHARSPLDWRSLYRREPSRIAKALGIFGTVGLGLRRLTGEERPARLARAALDALQADRSAGDHAWGYPWDTQTRWSFYPAGSPNVVVTSYAGLALVAAGDELGEDRYRERARKAATWTLETLYAPQGGFFAYHQGSDAVIHNASLLGARLVHRVLGDSAREATGRAVERTLAAQETDGSWPYGDAIGFVDSFHTGYVLDCLCALSDLDSAVEAAVGRGASYYANRFFDRHGRASLWPSSQYPIDAHSAGTALTTLATLVERGHVERELLERVAAHTAREVVRGGHAVHRRYRWGRTRVNYIRWCDAHVALGLVDAAEALDRPAPPDGAQALGSGRRQETR